MGSLGARHHNIGRKRIYEFETKEKWRESAIEKGFAGMSALNLLHKKKGPDGLQWLKDLKYWMEFQRFDRPHQDDIRKFVLAERKEELK
jgi:hypothetical protein